ncbi:nitroreductase [Nocardia huaxiensis]|uniref:Nitroreductase n=1 Tax=Nocardia huaxiensis TaxID=2755382 RepID=A0A7D6VH66_9NOCA|nr:nitroreductase [Nocardia huaxiensis]QLY29996.1 nitroreductase [Nocardia huaxiensis]
MTSHYTALEALLADRYTCRTFRPDAVPQETIESMLRLAQRTPSWCNTQPWHLTVTADPAATARFRKALLSHIEGTAADPDIPFPAAYTGIYRDRRKECGAALYTAVGVPKGDHAGSLRQMLRNFELFDAPHVAILTTEADLGTYGAVDCGLYLQSFLLSAQSLGVATAPQAALATYSPFLHDHFAIPANRQVVAGISFGYPDSAHPSNSFRTTRAPLDEAITWAS